MPLVRIDLMEGKPPDYRRALADGVYQALLEAVGAPENDQFVVLSEHGKPVWSTIVATLASTALTTSSLSRSL
jgi:phenylpyruvate tautomerase PptA (4-oxalocrotonate tautomerase family)